MILGGREILEARLLGIIVEHGLPVGEADLISLLVVARL